MTKLNEEGILFNNNWFLQDTYGDRYDDLCWKCQAGFGICRWLGKNSDLGNCTLSSFVLFFAKVLFFVFWRSSGDMKGAISFNSKYMCNLWGEFCCVEPATTIHAFYMCFWYISFSYLQFSMQLCLFPVVWTFCLCLESWNPLPVLMWLWASPCSIFRHVLLDRESMLCSTQVIMHFSTV